jgi:hypothetical protein
MKMVMVSAGVSFLIGFAPVVLAERPDNERGKELAALEQNLLADWKGQTPCAGIFLFRADGTYELTGFGPAPYDSVGTWKVRWDALPPTLVLTCKTSEVPDEVGKTTELKVIELDDKSLAVKRAGQDADRYARVKKTVRVGNAQGKQPPPGEPPQVWLASAVQQDGKVVIRFAHPEYVEPRKAVVADVMKWQDWGRTASLGDGVRAFGVNGKALDAKAVLNALAQPKGVVVFVRNHVRERPEDLSGPDAFNLDLFREGTIVLVVAGEDIFPLNP